MRLERVYQNLSSTISGSEERLQCNGLEKGYDGAGIPSTRTGQTPYGLTSQSRPE